MRFWLTVTFFRFSLQSQEVEPRMPLNASSVNFFLPTRIRFGSGVIKELPPFLAAHGVKRLFVVSDEGLAAAGVLKDAVAPLRAAGIDFDAFTAVPTNPALDCVEAALTAARSLSPDAVVSVGGGSPIDVAKVVALLLTNEGPLARFQWEGQVPDRPALFHVAVPTTAGTGSEVTRTAVIVDRGTKKGIVSDALGPTAAFIDPELTLTLTPALTAATGADALTHAIEAYVGKGGNVITAALAKAAVRLIASSLHAAVREGSDREARSRLAMGSTLAGIAMDQGGLGIVHSLSGPLSAWYGVHHGLSNAIFLAESIRFNAPVAAVDLAELAREMGLSTAGPDDEAATHELARACGDLMQELGVASLPDSMVFTDEEIKRMSEAAAGMILAGNNPRPVSPEDCRVIYRKVLRWKT